jgi:hypothetical protein
MFAASAARRRGDRAFWVAVAALLIVALGLRLWGIGHGLPFVYNADENAHFVPRAIGMFGHSYNPGYFINPPGFTYLLHILFWLRWGGDGVQDAYAADIGDVFTLARVAAAVLGAGAVALLLWAGVRLFDRRVGLLAAALLAVAFLPVHYSHLALNDVPATAGLCLALVGVAGVLRRGETPDYVLAGIGLGLAAATKYTAGIVLVCLVLASRDPRRLVLAGAAALAAFLVANPYALLDISAFREGLSEQSSASRDGGGKLGLTEENGLLYYLGTATWGLGWIPLLAAAAGAVLLVRDERRVALALLPAIAVFLVFMGIQDRFFARWLLPIYPLLALLAAYAAVRGAEAVRRAPRAALAVAAIALCAQGVVYSVHNDRVLSQPDTRELLREWMVANVPEGTKIVMEPIAPAVWAIDPGNPSEVTHNGERWVKWPTSRARIVGRPGPAQPVRLEDYERTLVPRFVDSYARGGYCWVITGSIQYGRAFAEPETVPHAIDYYAELARRGEVAARFEPWEGDGVPFSFDYSFNAYPLAYERPGPAITVRRLTGGDC